MSTWHSEIEMAAEDPADLTEDHEKCTMQFAQAAVKLLRFHSNLLKVDQYTAETAT
jgi:hypothetical protein